MKPEQETVAPLHAVRDRDAVLDALVTAPGPRGRRGLPAILWGPPGVGKTAAVEALAARHGLHLVTLLLAIREPTDVAGWPSRRDGAGAGVVLEPPRWALDLVERGAGLLFLDELTCAAPAVQAAALRVLAEGVVGELRLPPDVRILAAANPADQAAGGWELAAPLANRLLHLEWPAPSVDAWSAWLAGVDAPPAPPRALDDAAWGRAWGRARTTVAAFVRRRPALLVDVPADEATRGRAWPSPRSWEIAARALAAAWALELGAEDQLALIAGAVGVGAAREAWEFLSHLDLPEPADVLAGRAEVPIDRADRAWACLAGVAAVAAAPPVDALRVVRGLEVARAVGAAWPDVAVSAARPLLRSDLVSVASRDRRTRDRFEAVFADGPFLEMDQALRRR